jgi:hypothetical protein
VTRSRLTAALGAAPDFVLAGLALVTWIDPQRFGERLVGWFLVLMLVEFVVVHSAAFLGTVAFSAKSAAARARETLMLALFYTLFVGGFALAADAWWPLVSFWALIVNRLLGILLGAVPSGAERLYAMRSWAAGAMFMLGGVFVTVVLPLPAFGVRPEMLGAIGSNSSGAWVSEPHRVLAFAVLYFTAVGVSTLTDHRWLASSVTGTAAAGQTS